MSVNTARMLNRIFSNPAWKLLLVVGFLALLACFIIKGKKRVLPIIVCILSLCLYLVTAGMRERANDLIIRHAGTDPVKISDVNIQPPEVADSTENELKEADREMTTVAAGGPYGEISVAIPDDWTYEAAKVDDDKLVYGLYGLILRPADADDGQIELFCIDGFGVCGTGLETEWITLAGNAACVGTYDEHAHWDYIVMKDDNPDLVAQHTDCDSWTDEMWDEALEILDTAVFDEGKREGGVGQSIEESYDDNIAVVMRLTNVTSTGLTVHFEQYDKRDCGELIYGDGYHLQVQNGSGWEDVPTVIEDWGFNDIGYTLQPEGKAEQDIDWEWLYGKLAPGTYRITKTLIDSSRNDPSVNIPAYPLTAQFVLAGE